MNPSSLSLLLKTAAVLLLGIQHNPQASAAAMQQAIFSADQTVQVATQAMTVIPFATPHTSGIWTNITELQSAAYLNAAGTYVPLGNNADNNVSLLEQDTSFGDLNDDGFDDAAMIVQKTDGQGNTSVALAAVLNQGGSLFNIADITLGNNVQITSHHVVSNGVIVFDATIDGGNPTEYQYQLVGNQLMKI